MMYLDTPPRLIQAEVFSAMPDQFRRKGVATEWADANRPGQPTDCFIEGPSFDAEGNLHIVDIPFGRIFRIAPDGKWSLVVEYEGWPNGLKISREGRIFVADYRRGIMELDAKAGRMLPVLASRNSESFKGCNDLHLASNGDIYFTDQGQTGLQDPSGRLFRWKTSGEVDLILDGIPSPNGLVFADGERTLLLAVTRANQIWRLPLHPDGTTTKVGAFVTLSGGLAGPDGIAIDEEGNFAVAHCGLGTVWQFSRLGEPILRIRCVDGSSPTNLAYGGDGNRTLFIVEADSGTVLQANLSVPGRAMFSHL